MIYFAKPKNVYLTLLLVPLIAIVITELNTATQFDIFVIKI